MTGQNFYECTKRSNKDKVFTRIDLLVKILIELSYTTVCAAATCYLCVQCSFTKCIKLLWIHVHNKHIYWYDNIQYAVCMHHYHRTNQLTFNGLLQRKK